MYPRDRAARMNCNRRFRRLSLERFEDRRMLTVPVDVVFLADETGSADSVAAWIDSVVPDLDATLRGAGYDVRYGLVGYGSGDPERFAHSHIVGDKGGIVR